MKDFADRVQKFGQSSIDVMTGLCFKYHSVRLAAGTPGFDAPKYLIDIACKYLQNGHNQYTVNRGSERLRKSIRNHWIEPLDYEANIDSEITISCGATESLLACAMAVLNPGDKAVVFEPFYENFRSICYLSGADPLIVPLLPFEWNPDWEKLEEACKKAKLLIINSPNNPTGAVFSREVIAKIAELAVKYDLFVISDETYRTMVFEGEEPKSIFSFPGMAERTAVVSSFSKIMTITGWRVGFIVANEEFSAQIRKVHDFATICAPAPFQDAIADFWDDDVYTSYFSRLMASYRKKRDGLCEALRIAGFKFSVPQGAYYVLADFSNLRPDLDDFEMCDFMALKIGVCVVGGRAFFNTPESSKKYLRFSFAQQPDLIKVASNRIKESFREV